MDRRYSKKGVKIVAPEVQGSAVDAIMDVVDDGKIKFTVTKGISGPRLGNYIPRMAVFDATGKLSWVGHPNSAEKAIKEALKTVDASGSSSSGSGLPARKADLVAQRDWTNTDGNKLTATLVSVTGTTGHFKKSNGQKFDYDITKLSEPDQKLIKESSEAAAKAE